MFILLPSKELKKLSPPSFVYNILFLFLFFLFFFSSFPFFFFYFNMPFINTQQKEEKYRFVDEILAAPDYYRVLGIKKDSTPEEVRRAYIKVSLETTYFLMIINTTKKEE